MKRGDGVVEGRNEMHEEAGSGRRVTRRFVGAAVVLLVLGGLAVVQRRLEYRALARTTEQQAVLNVTVIPPTAEPPQEELVLPGTLQAYVEAPIYARTSGYLKRWYHDIGSRVRRGEPLAELDTPEVDQQLLQARADLATAKANARLAETTAARFREVLKADGVSKQEVDTAAGEAEARQAALASAEANAHRLLDLESFKRIAAPFDGVITRRNVDVGTLVNAGNGGQTQQLFFLAQTDPVRVFVGVPERYAPAVRPGSDAHLVLAEYPGREFHGHVARTSEAIDTGTRTLLTEVDVANRDGVLLPGAYAQVHLQLKVAGGRLQVPVNTLLFRAEGLRVAVVDGSGRVHLRALTIGRDYGIALEVLEGLQSGERLVLNPPDSLDEGQLVRVSAQATAARAEGSAERVPSTKVGD